MRLYVAAVTLQNASVSPGALPRPRSAVNCAAPKAVLTGESRRSGTCDRKALENSTFCPARE